MSRWTKKVIGRLAVVREGHAPDDYDGEPGVILGRDPDEENWILGWREGVKGWPLEGFPGYTIGWYVHEGSVYLLPPNAV